MKSKDLYPGIFSRHAEAYERRMEQVMGRGEAKARERAIELLELVPGMRVLDLACGPGTLTARVARLVLPGGQVVGVDLATGMIERARLRRIAGATFEVMDMERLALPDGSFDAALCGHGLQFVPDLSRALAEARRVLRRGARFAASVPWEGEVAAVQMLPEEVVRRHLPPAPRPVDHEATRRTLSDPEALTAAARGAGFGDVRVESVEETMVWQSAEQLVALCSSWWECAARLEPLDDNARAAFLDDAVTTLRRKHPGPIEINARNLVLLAIG